MQIKGARANVAKELKYTNMHLCMMYGCVWWGSGIRLGKKE